MSSTTFVDYSSATPIVASWLNDVNDAVYKAIGTGGSSPVAPKTHADVIANLNLAAVVGTPDQVRVTLGLSQVLTSVAQVNSLLKTGSPQVFITGYAAAHDGGGGAYTLDLTDTTTPSNGGSVLVAADGGRWKLNQFTHVNVAQFGIFGDGSTDNATRMAAMVAWVATKLAAGNAFSIVWGAGRYSYSSCPNFALTGLSMVADGEVWLINTGPGVSFLLDGGAVGAGVYGMNISGNFLVYPNASSLAGVFIRAVHRSYIQLDSRGGGTGFPAISLAWCVVTEFHLRASSNEGGWYNTPTYALFATSRGAGEQVSYCTFVNPVFEGAPTNVYLDGALGNTFLGGTFEAATSTGLQLTVNAVNNKFLTIDLESNATADIVCAGTGNEFLCCDTLTKVEFSSGATNNHLIGGLHQQVTVDSGAVRTLLSDFTYNRLNNSAVIVDNGTSTRYRDLTNFGTGIIHNVPLTITTLTVGASPFNYQNNTANEVTVLLEPGIITGVSMVRQGSFFTMPNTSGWYSLSPGDSLQVAYSSIPAVYVWTR